MVEITIKNIRDFQGDLNLRDGDLPFGMWDVFDRHAFESSRSAIIVMIDDIVSTKNQLEDPKFVAGLKPDPRQNAFDKMKSAARGELAKRGPVLAKRCLDGKYRLTDGNATSQVLMMVGWRELPVEIVEDPVE